MRHLDAAGLAHAGTGRNYAEAVAPAYLETATRPRGTHLRDHDQSAARARRRAAPRLRLVDLAPTSSAGSTSGASTDRRSPSCGASPARCTGASGHRPGGRAPTASHQKPSPTWCISATRTRSVSRRTWWRTATSRFVLGDGFGQRGRLHHGGRAAQPRQHSRRPAHGGLGGLQHPQPRGRRARSSEPSEHVRELAHAVIDAGADIVVGHGPHRDRGIEIYDGKADLLQPREFSGRAADNAAPAPRHAPGLRARSRALDRRPVRRALQRQARRARALLVERGARAGVRARIVWRP